MPRKKPANPGQLDLVPTPETREKAPAGGDVEWVGTRITSPFYVTEPEPFRPELLLWMERPSGFVVGQRFLNRDEPDSLGELLREAMECPLIGPARRPSSVCVTSKKLVAEVRATAQQIPIRVGPAPEIDELLESLLEAPPPSDEGPSYLEGGRVPAELMRELFTLADMLYRVAPWRHAYDGQILRADVPSLGVSGACISILGALGQTFGLVIFPSLPDYERFATQAMRPPRRRGAIDLGSATLALTFERAAELPPEMRQEVKKHGWKVAGPSAYPMPQSTDRDGTARPLTERDVRSIVACTRGLTAFAAKNGDVFEAEKVRPICESYDDAAGNQVTITFPHEAFDLFDLSDDSQATTATRVTAPAAGRNDPCPCGSGKKYKKCHLQRDEEQRRASEPKAPAHLRDEQVVGDLRSYARKRFRNTWLDAHEDMDPSQADFALRIPWSVYGADVEGKSVAEWYVAERGRSLSAPDRSWIESQRAAWLSIWEVREVQPGSGLTLHDLLSGEERRVHEVKGSQVLVARDVLLARIVDHDGISVMCGNHGRVLGPRDASEVARKALARLRRKSLVPVEKLRSASFGEYLIARWEDAAYEADLRRKIPPVIQNTDGDDLLRTVDHFKLESADRGRIETCIHDLGGVETESTRAQKCYDFLRSGNALHRSWENTVIGRAVLSASKLRVETNSIARADALRAKLETAGGAWLTHVAREHADPMSTAHPRSNVPPPAPPPEALEMIRELKQQHYRDWLDQSIPALGGKTPREAARSARDRQTLELLLKEIENHESRAQDGTGISVVALRSTLGL